MYAIVKTGGKQYKVAEGDVLFVEKLEGNAGDVVTLNEVLACTKDGELVVGAPTVEGASVQAKVVEQGKAKKVIVFKYKAIGIYKDISFDPFYLFASVIAFVPPFRTVLTD